MFILQNQDGYFLSKSGDWTDGRDCATLFRTEHKDEAVNQLFEINNQDYSLRITILECESNAKKQPIIESDKLPPLLHETNAEEDMELNLINNDSDAESTIHVASQ